MTEALFSMKRFGEVPRAVLQRAQSLADDAHYQDLTVVHWLICFLNTDQNRHGSQGIHDVFRRVGGDPEVLLSELGAEASQLLVLDDAGTMTEALLELLGAAERHADARGNNAFVCVSDLFLALAEQPGEAGPALIRAGVAPKALPEHLQALTDAEDVLDQKLLLSTSYTSDAYATIDAAEALSAREHHDATEPLHLFISILTADPSVQEIVERIGLETASALREARELLARLDRSEDEEPWISGALIVLLRAAHNQALDEGSDKITIEHLVHAFTHNRPQPLRTMLKSARDKVRAAAPSPPAEPWETIVVCVRDQDGTSIPRAKVSLEGAEDALTDENGKLSLEVIIPAKLIFDVSAEGYERRPYGVNRLSFDIGPESARELDVVMDLLHEVEVALVGPSGKGGAPRHLTVSFARGQGAIAIPVSIGSTNVVVELSAGTYRVYTEDGDPITITVPGQGFVMNLHKPAKEVGFAGIIKCADGSSPGARLVIVDARYYPLPRDGSLTRNALTLSAASSGKFSFTKRAEKMEIYIMDPRTEPLLADAGPIVLEPGRICTITLA